MHMTALVRSKLSSTSATEKPKQEKIRENLVVLIHSLTIAVSMYHAGWWCNERPNSWNVLYYYHHVTDYESKCTMHQYLKGNKNSDKPTPHRPHFHEAMHDCMKSLSWATLENTSRRKRWNEENLYFVPKPLLSTQLTFKAISVASWRMEVIECESQSFVKQT